MTRAIRLVRESSNFRHSRREVNTVGTKKWSILAHSGELSFHSGLATTAQHPAHAPPVFVASAPASVKLEKMVEVVNGKKFGPPTFPTGRRAVS
jgi:hypothetical protein